METYTQAIKSEAREKLISHAIESLTTNRAKSYLVSTDFFEKITEKFNSQFRLSVGAGNVEFLNTYNWLFSGEKSSWNEFYKDECKPKSVKELKVLYLAGPEPQNDIDVLHKHGIRSENIWAIESNKSVYNQALRSLIEANIHIKLHRGTLSEFFEYTNHEFDIVYYDACTPIFSSEDSPYDTLKQLFLNKRLNKLSALITNFSEPKNNYNWGEIMATWFCTKHEWGIPSEDYQFNEDPAIKVASFKEYALHIDSNEHAYYDKFIQHFIPALAGEIIPIWQTVSLSSTKTNYLLNEQMLVKKLNEIRNYNIKASTLEELIRITPHYMLAIDAYGLLNWVRIIRENFPAEHFLAKTISEKRKKTSLEDAMYVGSLLKRFEEEDSAFKTFIYEICGDRLKSILEKLDFFDRPLRLTCDAPMKNLLIELLIGLYGHPYIANANHVISLKYKAKETWMFSDVFIFDQCRYLYDYIPTLDLWESFFEKNWPSQVAIRACMDGIHRNHHSLNSSLFKWSFIEEIYGEFGYASLSPRINLNEK